MRVNKRSSMRADADQIQLRCKKRRTELSIEKRARINRKTFFKDRAQGRRGALLYLESDRHVDRSWRGRCPACDASQRPRQRGKRNWIKRQSTTVKRICFQHVGPLRPQIPQFTLEPRFAVGSRVGTAACGLQMT